MLKNKDKKISLNTLGATVSSLSATVGSLSVKVDTLTLKVDVLASTMEQGFKSVEDRIDKGFKEAKEDNESLASMVANGFERTDEKIFVLAEGFSALKAGMNTLEQGQENIKLRLDSLAPKFEVTQIGKRVKRLEVKAGIRHPV